MKLAILVFTVLILCAPVHAAFALDWKSLHEFAYETDVAEAEAAVTENPGSIDALYVLGLVYLIEYRDDDARSVFFRILDNAPQALEAEWAKAELLRREYKIEASTKILRKIIETDPSFSPAYITLAYITFNMKEFRESARLAAVVIKQGRDNVDIANYVHAHLIFAGAKGMIAHFGGPMAKIAHGLQVFPHLKRARQLLPDYARVHFGLGAFYLLAPVAIGGNIDKAQTHLEKAVAGDPHLVDAFVRLAQVYKVKGDLEKFQEYLDIALEKDPRNPLANDIKSRTCDFICVEPR